MPSLQLRRGQRGRLSYAGAGDLGIADVDGWLAGAVDAFGDLAVGAHAIISRHLKQC